MIRGNIKLSVSKQDLNCLDFKDYAQCYQQTESAQQYYVPENSSIYQMFDESPQWVHDIARQLPQDFDNHVVSIIKVNPGNTIPLHRDLHYKLRSTYDLTGITYRYLVFLEDWKTGHYFEIYNRPCVEWRAGDWIKFTNEDWHLGGNMGLEPFYSVQITVQ